MMQTYGVEDLRAQAKEILDLELPVSVPELEAGFKKAAKRLHPDTGGSHEAFLKASDLKDYLLTHQDDPQLILTSESKLNGKMETTDGIPLHELGRGLPSEKNAVACTDCGGSPYLNRRGLGYLAETATVGDPITCINCKGLGTVSEVDKICRWCNQGKRHDGSRCPG